MNKIHLVLPKTQPNHFNDRLRKLPLFFLAGPILGGGDWHTKMSLLLQEKVGECIIVNPSRYDSRHPLYEYRIIGNNDVFERQTDWERYFLKQASEGWATGCIIFWLPCENECAPRTDGLPYAMDTRGEIGEWRGHLMHNKNLRVVMGAEPSFPGLSQITRNFELSLGDTFRIYSTMEDVVDRASFFADPKNSFYNRTHA